MPTSQYQEFLDDLPQTWSDSDVVVLSDSISIDIIEGSNGNKAVIREAKWYLINNPQSPQLEPFAFASSEYFQSAPSLSLHWYLPKAGNGSFMTTDFFSRQQNFYQGRYATGVTVYSAQPGYWERGMIVRFEYVYINKHPEFLSQFSGQSSLPVVKSNIEIHTPEGFELKTKWVGKSLVPVTENPVRKSWGNTYSWDIGPRAPLIPTGNYRLEEWYPALHVSIPAFGKKHQTWSEMGDYYLSQFEEEMNAQSSAIDSLARGKSPQQIMDLIRAKIRYHADMRGESAIVPRSTASTLENGFGDCKGMSLLLWKMLRSAGYKASLVLVTANEENSQPLDDLPTLGRFDHMIVALEGENNQTVFLDPTNSWSRWDETVWPIIGQKCLILSKGKSNYAQIQFAPSARSEIHTVSNFLNGSDSLMEVTMTWMGSPSYIMHGLVAIRNPSERSVFLRGMIKDQFHLDAKSVRLLTDTVGYFSVAVQVKADHFWKPDLVLPTPGHKSGAGWMRIRPLQQVDTWTIPEKWKIQNVPEEYSNTLGKVSWKVEGRTVQRRFERNSGSKVTDADLRVNALALQNQNVQVRK